MIGLARPSQQANDNEPAVIRGKTKNQLYTMLAEEWFLPSVDSKGVNRQYLVSVFKGEVLRLPLMEIKRFEVELTPMQQKRTGLVNLTYTLSKLNVLLGEMDLKPLGFPQWVVPEEVWLTKIARFIDKKNVMEFFSQTLEPINIPSNMSERVHDARQAVFKFVFDNNNLMQNHKVYQAVKEISDTYRRIISKTIDLEDLEHQKKEMSIKLSEEEAHLKSSLLRASTTIMAIAEEDFNPDQIYLEGGNQQNRLKLAEISKL